MITINHAPRCAWCQKKDTSVVEAFVRMRRYHYETVSKMFFCDVAHAKQWKESVGDRFVRWERKLSKRGVVV